MVYTPIPPYVPPYAPIPTIQPFTYRDGVTYWEKLNGIIRYVNRVILPYVYDHINDFGEEFANEINALTDQVNDAINLVINNSVTLQDPVLAGIIDDSSSESRSKLDALYVNQSELDDAVTTINTQIDVINTSITSINNAITAVNSRVDDTASDITDINAILNGRLSVTEMAKYVKHDEIIFNVKDYGAKGDGVTNDSAAIQATIDAAAIVKGCVLFPFGTYMINTTIRIKDGITLIGYGATISRMNAPVLGTMFMNWASGDTTTSGYNGWSNISVFGLTLNANGDTNLNNPANIMTFDHCKNITIRDVKFLNTSGYHALEFNGVNGGVVDRCKFMGFIPVTGVDPREAFQIDITTTADGGAKDDYPSINISVTGNYFGPNGVIGAHAGSVASHTWSSAVPNAYFQNIVVTGNIIESMQDFGIQAYHWRDSIISNNVVLDPVSHGIIMRTSCVNITVANNSIRYNAFRTAAANIFGISATDSADIVEITGNTIIRPSQGIYCGGNARHINVTDNHVWLTSSYGISLNTADSVVIDSNIITGPGSEAGGLGAIRVSAPGPRAESAVIQNNVVRKHGVAGIPEVTVGVSSTDTMVLVRNNVFYDLSDDTSGIDEGRRGGNAMNGKGNAFNIYNGSVTINATAGGTVSADVTLPAGMFNVTPRVVANAVSALPSEIDAITISNKSATGFTIYLQRSTSGDTAIDWIAMSATTSN